jgi:hypothetical protein
VEGNVYQFEDATFTIKLAPVYAANGQLSIFNSREVACVLVSDT